MGTKEQMIKEILSGIFGNGSKALSVKGSVSFEYEVTFKDTGEVIINEKNNYNDCVVESVKEVDLNSDSKETNGWDSI